MTDENTSRQPAPPGGEPDFRQLANDALRNRGQEPAEWLLQQVVANIEAAYRLGLAARPKVEDAFEVDLQRVRDIARLTIERDEAREKLAEREAELAKESEWRENSDTVIWMLKNSGISSNSIEEQWHEQACKRHAARQHGAAPMTKATTPEQIAEAIKHLRSIGSFTRDSAYSICNEAADLIEALAAHLVEAQEIKVSMQRWIDHHNERADKAEAEAASAREIIEAATAWRADLENDGWTKDAIEDGFAREPIARLMRAVGAHPKSTPSAPTTPSTESEVMPDTSGSRSNSGDTATPQASMLAPGADALIDRNALIDLLAKIEDGPYLGAEGVADAVIELLLPNLIRAHGGKP